MEADIISNIDDKRHAKLKLNKIYKEKVRSALEVVGGWLQNV